MTILYFFLIFLFLFLCAFMCLVILMQESKSFGLGASFGGDAGSSVFGTSTADVIKKFTGYLALIFFVTAVVLSIWTASLGRAKLTKTPAMIEEVDES